ncbi:MAG: hypothetical protein ABSE06_13375 [Anaerolineaceae bacterium]
MKTQLSPQDWQQLSAYLDGQLSTTEEERLETRLHTQTSLRDGLEEIRQTRTVLRSVPRRKVPHNFFLTRAMVAEQAKRRSVWFPVLGFTSLVSLMVLVAVSLLFQFQTSAAPAPVAMQAARSDQSRATLSTSQPMIIQWGNGGVGSGGGGSGAVPQVANPPAATNELGGGQPQAPQNNSLMNGQATPEAGVEAAPAVTEAAVPRIAVPNTGAPAETPAAISQPALAAPTEAPVAVENTPTAGTSVQEKQVPNQAEGPVNIFGIAPTQEQGLIQSTPPATENYQAPGAPANLLPFIQAGLIILAVTAGLLAFLLRKKT